MAPLVFPYICIVAFSVPHRALGICPHPRGVFKSVVVMFLGSVCIRCSRHLGNSFFNFTKEEKFLNPFSEDGSGHGK
jgi:hypothetical protein